MLDALELRPGMRVLEIGTGTGDNAAPPAELTGAENVTTVEVDASLADHARRALEQAGYPVMVITDDGMLAHPGNNAPYERITGFGNRRFGRPMNAGRRPAGPRRPGTG